MQFANCYGDPTFIEIWQQENSINLEQQQHTLLQQLDNKFGGGTISQTASSKQYRFVISNLYPQIQILAIITLNKYLGEVSIDTILLKNGLFLKVKSKPLVILLCRYFNKINSSIKNGTYRVNPFSSEIRYKQLTVFSAQQYNLHISNQTKGYSYLLQQLNTVVQSIKFNFYKILLLISQTTFSFQKYLLYKRFDCRFTDRKCEEILEKIKRSIAISHIEQQFMWYQTAKKNKKKTEEQLKNIKDQSEIQIFNVNNSMQQPFIIKNHLNHIDSEKDLNFTQFQSFLSDVGTVFAKNLAIPIPRPNNQSFNIIQKINITISQNIKWETVEDGGFTQIQKSKLTINSIPINQTDLQVFKIISVSQFMKIHRRRIADQRQNMPPAVTRVIAKKKQTIQVQQNKILHQKRILLNLLYDTSNYVNKFFFSQQGDFKDTLLMEFLPGLSLQHYRKSHQSMLSLLTKIYLLIQCNQGIRFLHDRQIIHFDIKPLNFLMGKKLQVKITDFGQAYHSRVCKEDYKPGFTIPYSPPEVFKQQNIDFSEKNDVFSFGVMMYQILFDSLPIQVNKKNINRIYNYFLSDQYIRRFKMLPERAQKYGPTQLMKSLALLMSKCLDPNPKKRPCMDWILLILKDCITYVDAWF